MLILAFLFLVAMWASAQNALAGGGTFLTLPALMFAGLDARLANIASTIALFPGQVTSAWAAAPLISGVGVLGVRALVLISLAGGAAGALLLLWTPSDFFERLVPWLVLFATAVFAWGSFLRKPHAEAVLGPGAAAAAQFAISVYGGYFGGGIGFLMIAALSLTGMGVRAIGGTKNLLAGVMNASAVVLFLLFAWSELPWDIVAATAAGGVAGGYVGGRLLHRVPEKALRLFIILIGLTLTVGLFVRQGA